MVRKSKELSGRGSCSARPSMKCAANLDRATSSIPSLGSRQVMFSAVPRMVAASTATKPVAQAVFLQRPTPVGSSTLEEAPAHHGIVMPGSSVEQTVDELRLLLGCAVMLGQREVGKHRHKLAQSQPDTSRKPGRAIWQRLLL